MFKNLKIALKHTDPVIITIAICVWVIVCSTLGFCGVHIYPLTVILIIPGVFTGHIVANYLIYKEK
jgi:hypothetical protein